MLISRGGRQYRKRVGAILADMGAPSISGPLAVEVEAFPPDERKRDLDNLQKCLFDSLQHGRLFDDDFEIARIAFSRQAVVEGGVLIVRIKSA